MKTRIYLNEWFLNAGIVGFVKILKHNKDNFAKIEDNYIEFDTNNLRNFHKYYFNFFFDKYNVAERIIRNTSNAFDYINQNIELVPDDKTELKNLKDKIKSNKKYIKDTFKKQLDKIKKIDEIVYEKMKNEYDKVDNINTAFEIEKVRDILIECIQEDKINKRLTMNLFKSILSNTYYGQPSFLNVINSSFTYELQENIMYRDYVSNLVEMQFLQDILEDKYDLEQIRLYIQKNQEESNSISKDMQKIYLKIMKECSKKESNIENIKEYIEKNVLTTCFMCENEHTLTTNYSESNFVPLAISSDNMKNFFWNQNAKYPVCDICKLILFCIPAGITNITKVVKENEIYKEKTMLNFVNYDTSVENLLRTNINFEDSLKYNNKNINPYSELILNIVGQNKQITKWQLQNIFVVEFEAEYLAFSRMEYFNIKEYMARFFMEYAEKTLNKITDYKYKLQLVDYILKNKDTKYVIADRLMQELKDKDKLSYNSLLAISTRLILNLLKKEDIKVEEINKNNNKLYAIYNLGIDIHEQFKQSGEENKLDGYTYKMLNSIKSGNKKEFMDIVIRLHMAKGKSISPIFLEIMQDTNLDFESIGHSFLAGLISDKYEKKEEKVNEY